MTLLFYVCWPKVISPGRAHALIYKGCIKNESSSITVAVLINHVNIHNIFWSRSIFWLSICSGVYILTSNWNEPGFTNNNNKVYQVIYYNTNITICCFHLPGWSDLICWWRWWSRTAFVHICWWKHFQKGDFLG